MRLALFAGASPQRSSDGPISRLIGGRYRIHAEGLADSELDFSVDGVRLAFGDELLLGQASNVQVKFLKRGSEKAITIIAERVS